MDIGKIAGATGTIGESQGYQGLPIRATLVIDPANSGEALKIESAWLPTMEERLAILNGAPIILENLYMQPPTMLRVGTAADVVANDA